MELVSEFFFEGLRRIIPGLVIIILYWHEEAEAFYRRHSDFFSPTFFSVCIVTIAWLIGFIIESLTYYPFKPVIKKCEEASGRYRTNTANIYQRCIFWLIGESGNPLIVEKEAGKSEAFQRELRRHNYLHESGKIMSRCLFVTFLFALFKPPESLEVISWSCSYSLAFFIMFFFTWRFRRVKGTE